MALLNEYDNSYYKIIEKECFINNDNLHLTYKIYKHSNDRALEKSTSQARQEFIDRTDTYLLKEYQDLVAHKNLEDKAFIKKAETFAQKQTEYENVVKPIALGNTQTDKIKFKELWKLLGYDESWNESDISVIGYETAVIPIEPTFEFNITNLYDVLKSKILESKDI